MRNKYQKESIDTSFSEMINLSTRENRDALGTWVDLPPQALKTNRRFQKQCHPLCQNYSLYIFEIIWSYKNVWRS